MEELRVHRARPDITEACDKLIGIMTSPDWPEIMKSGQASVDGLIFEIAREYSTDAASAGGKEQANAGALPSEALRDDTQIILTEKNPNALQTLSMNELYDSVYQNRPPIIEGLLYSGTYIFAGAPKVGKSFFMAQLAYHVSTGQKLWGHEVHPSGVLYLALEDDYQRLQNRLFRMFGVNGTDELHLAVQSKLISDGLDHQLELFIKEHPDTKLIIIDTLQKVREVSSDSYSYSSDYDVIGRLKTFADQNGLCIIIVHHTRKTQAGDHFEMISGTTGILGCADGAFLMRKEIRTANAATLEIVGRDQPDQTLHLVKEQEHLCWLLDHADVEVWEEPADSVLDAVSKLLVPEKPEWAGNATELAELLKLEKKPNALTKHLNIKAGELEQTYHILYRNEHCRDGSRITLKLMQTEAVSERAQTENVAPADNAQKGVSQTEPGQQINGMLSVQLQTSIPSAEEST